MYACTSDAMVMDRLCAHALAGSCCGLGRKSETRSSASPCPSAWTACGFGAQAFAYASAFNANIGAWNTASVSDMAFVCAAPGPAARTMADALGRAFGAARPVVRCGTADARAHTCRHWPARGLGCRYGRAEGRFDTCIRISIYI
jgi:surface protein